MVDRQIDRQIGRQEPQPGRRGTKKNQKETKRARERERGRERARYHAAAVAVVVTAVSQGKVPRPGAPVYIGDMTGALFLFRFSLFAFRPPCLPPREDAPNASLASR